jgi:ABC-type uncharacterized transport system substrate-binding protein
MRRREFITLLGCSAAAWPLVAHAQQSQKIPRVGMLFTGSAAGVAELVEGFRVGLRDRGYVDGHSIAVEVRYADGNLERLKELAKELTQQVNVIVVANSTAAQAVLGAAKNFPIVIAGGSIDPIAEGLADSLANPGHNVTGVSALLRDMGAKYIELAKEVSPRISRVAMLFDKHQPYVFDKTASEVAARQLGIGLEWVEFQRPEEFAAIFDHAHKQGIETVIVLSSPQSYHHAAEIAKMAIDAKMVTIGTFKHYSMSGFLISYASDLVDSYRRAAAYVDKILNGAKPGDLPIDEATKFQVVLNLKTAANLGLNIPQSILIRANEVIE